MLRSDVVSCQAFIDEASTPSDKHCDMRVTGQNESETGKMSCKVEKSVDCEEQ